MGMNNEGIINRRQLLVKAGSLMKLSWRKSREKLIEMNEDDVNDDNNLRQRRLKRNLSVRFSDDLCVVFSNHDEPMSDEEKDNRWYQSSDYSRFKKDTILNSLNYINARRASKPFDETKNCIWGIEYMCFNPAILKKYTTEKKVVYRVIREEQARQKKECQLKPQQKQQHNQTMDNGNDKKNSSSPYPDLEKFRSVSVCYTKGGRDRALALGNEYARAQQRSLGLGGIRSSSSMKNLFVSFRTQSAATVS